MVSFLLNCFDKKEELIDDESCYPDDLKNMRTQDFLYDAFYHKSCAYCGKSVLNFSGDGMIDYVTIEFKKDKGLFFNKAKQTNVKCLFCSKNCSDLIAYLNPDDWKKMNDVFTTLSNQ